MQHLGDLGFRYTAPGYAALANVIAGCKSNEVGSNKRVHEATGSKDAQN